MYKRLGTAILVTTFGRGASRPAKAVCIRLAGLWVMAIALSMLLGGSLNTTPLPVQAPHLIFVAAFVSQIVTLFVLITAAGVTRPNQTDTLMRLLCIWPLSSTVRWIALLLPSVILVLLALTLLCYPLAAILLAAGLPPLLLPIGMLLGAVSALGLIHGIPRRFAWVQFLVIPGVLWSEYRLLNLLSNQDLKHVSIACLTLLLGLLCVLFIHSRTFASRTVATGIYRVPIRTTNLPTYLWFIKKIARAPLTRLGFVTTLLMASVGAYLSAHAGGDSSLAALVASLLAGAYASDTRSLSRQYRPPEIASLRGTAYFVSRQITSTISCTLVAILPLLAYIALSDSVLVSYLQIAAGTAAGIFAGTLLVPGPRDITGQFLATLLSTALIGSMTQIPIVAALGPTPLHVIYISTTLALLNATYVVEYRRNTYKWRPA